MHGTPHNGGELSQDELRPELHRSRVDAKVPLNDPASRRARNLYNSLSASTVGLELGVAVVLALLGGMWLDGELGTEPWFMLAGLVIGLIAGFRNVMRAIERSDRAAALEQSVPRPSGRGTETPYNEAARG
jgi:ATP synthase protein I